MCVIRECYTPSAREDENISVNLRTKRGIGCGVLRIILYLTILPLAGFFLSLPGARSALKYRHHGPDAVTVEDILQGRAVPGDYVTVQGALWETHAFVEERDTGPQEYMLLVADDDPALKEWPVLVAQCNTKLKMEDPDILRMSKAERLHWTSEIQDLSIKMWMLPCTRLIAVATESGVNYQMITDSQLSSLQGGTGGGADSSERPQMVFSQWRQLLLLLRDSVQSESKITGVVTSLPDEAADEYTKLSTMKRKPTFFIKQGSKPEERAINICATFGSLLFLELIGGMVWIAWAIRKRASH